MTQWRVGMRCRCIKPDKWRDDYDPRYSDLTRPRFGDELTVRDVHVSVTGKVGLRFKEIKNPPRRYFIGVTECSFHADHFRPITKQKRGTETGVAILKSIAANPKQKIRDTADA